MLLICTILYNECNKYIYIFVACISEPVEVVICTNGPDTSPKLQILDFTQKSKTGAMGENISDNGDTDFSTINIVCMRYYL